MMWQDLVLTTLNFVYAASLIPQAMDMRRGKFSMNKYTCAITCGGLMITTIVYASFNLWVSVVTSLANVCIWGALFYLVITGTSHKKR